jgi:hypothetical protein
MTTTECEPQRAPRDLLLWLYGKEGPRSLGGVVRPAGARLSGADIPSPEQIVEDRRLADRAGLAVSKWMERGGGSHDAPSAPFALIWAAAGEALHLAAGEHWAVTVLPTWVLFVASPSLLCTCLAAVPTNPEPTIPPTRLPPGRSPFFAVETPRTPLVAIFPEQIHTLLSSPPSHQIWISNSRHTRQQAKLCPRAMGISTTATRRMRVELKTPAGPERGSGGRCLSRKPSSCLLRPSVRTTMTSLLFRLLPRRISTTAIRIAFG